MLNSVLISTQCNREKNFLDVSYWSENITNLLDSEIKRLFNIITINSHIMNLYRARYDFKESMLILLKMKGQKI